MTRLLASLAMYPFVSVRPHWDAIWERIREELVAGGVDGVPDRLSWDGDLHDEWRSPDLLLGHTCGWPLVDALDGVVEVVGAFDPDVPFAADGHYRSVLIASKPWSFAEWRSQPGVVAAVNNDDSLSGWISLCAAWGGRPPATVVTGAHIESMRAVAGGAAHVACIDAVSFELIAAEEPVTAARVHVVGHGPRIPFTPLVCARDRAGLVPALRAAVATAVADPALAGHLAALRLRGFVPFDHTAYDWLVSLAPPPAS